MPLLRNPLPRAAIAAIGLIAVSLCQLPSSLRAADSADVDAGRALAERWCAECHQVAGRPTTVLDQMAPAFYSVANLRSTTGMSLHAFLSSPHSNMPNFRLSQPELDEVVEYILSMRQPGS